MFLFTLALLEVDEPIVADNLVAQLRLLSSNEKADSNKNVLGSVAKNKAALKKMELAKMYSKKRKQQEAQLRELSKVIVKLNGFRKRIAAKVKADAGKKQLLLNSSILTKLKGLVKKFNPKKEDVKQIDTTEANTKNKTKSDAKRMGKGIGKKRSSSKKNKVKKMYVKKNSKTSIYPFKNKLGRNTKTKTKRFYPEYYSNKDDVEDVMKPKMTMSEICNDVDGVCSSSDI